MDKSSYMPIFKRLRRPLLVVGSIFIVIGFLGFLVMPPAVRWLLADVLREQLHRPVSIGSVSINPYILAVEVRELRIGEDAEELAGFESLYLNASLLSIVRGGPVIEELRLDRPRVRLVRDAPGHYNISDLLDEWLKPSDSPPPRFSVNNIQVTGGSLEFDDRPQAARHQVSDIVVRLPFISNLATKTDIFIEPAFSAVVDGAHFELVGRSKPFSDAHESELNLDLRQLQLSRYLGYSPLPLPFRLSSGELDSDLKIVFRSPVKQSPSLSISGAIGLRDFEIAEADGKPLLSLRKLDLPMNDIDPLIDRYGLGRITVEGLAASIHIDEQGEINWLALAKKLQGRTSPKPVPKEASKPPIWSLAGLHIADSSLRWRDESALPKIDAQIQGFEFTGNKLDSTFSTPLDFQAALTLDAGPMARAERIEVEAGQLDVAGRRLGLGQLRVNNPQALIIREADGRLLTLRPPILAGMATEPAKPVAATPWIAEIASAEVAGLGIRFEDHAVSPHAIQVLEGRLALSGISTKPEKTGQIAVAMRINRKGEFHASGDLQIQPFATKLAMDVRAIDIMPIQPYFADKVNLTVSSGRVSAKGDLKLALSPAGELSGGYRGSATLGNFHSVDKPDNEDFLSCKSFHLGAIDLGLSPFAIAIGNVALTDFFARIVVNPEGKLNLMQIAHQGGGGFGERFRENRPGSGESRCATAGSY